MFKWKVVGALLIIISISLPLNSMSFKKEEKISKFNRIGINILNSLVKKNIPREFIFDDLDFSFLKGIGVNIINLRMSENPDFLDHPLNIYDYFYRSDNTEVKIKFLPLLIAKVHLHSLTVTNPEIFLIRDEIGRFSIEDMFREQRKGPVLDWLNVDDMEVTGGVFHLSDASAIREPLKITFDQMDTTISGFSLNKDFSVAISLKGPGASQKNIFFDGKAGPIKDSENFQEVPLDMDFRMENEPLIPYIPMIPKGMPIPVAGNIFLNYHVKGNMWSGLNMKGDLLIKDIVLISEKDGLRSIPFLFSISSGEEMKITSKDKIFDLKNGCVRLNKTELYMNGRLSNYKDNPKLVADFKSPAIDLEDIKKIHPFQEKYMPEGMSYSGFCEAEMHVEGTREKVMIASSLNLTDAFYEAPGFFSKKKSVRQLFDFEASVHPETLTIQSKGNIDSGEILLTVPDLNTTIKKKFFAGLKKGVKGLSIKNLNEDEPIVIEALNGQINYNEATMTLVNMELKNCHQKNMDGMDALVNGSVDINNETVNVSGVITLSRKDSKMLIDAGSSYSCHEVNEEGRLPIPVKITGTLKNPVIYFQTTL